MSSVTFFYHWVQFIPFPPFSGTTNDLRTIQRQEITFILGLINYVFIRFGLDYGGLLVIAICTGGIKPCVSAFAADQVRCSSLHSFPLCPISFF